jgi:hypothetical protein
MCVDSDLVCVNYYFRRCFWRETTEEHGILAGTAMAVASAGTYGLAPLSLLYWTKQFLGVITHNAFLGQRGSWWRGRRGGGRERRGGRRSGCVLRSELDRNGSWRFVISSLRIDLHPSSRSFEKVPPFPFVDARGSVLLFVWATKTCLHANAFYWSSTNDDGRKGDSLRAVCIQASDVYICFLACIHMQCLPKITSIKTFASSSHL